MESKKKRLRVLTSDTIRGLVLKLNENKILKEDIVFITRESSQYMAIIQE